MILRVRYSGRAVLRRVEALALQVRAEVAAAMEEVAAMPAGAHPMLAVFGEAIAGRCATVISNLRDVGDAIPAAD